MANIQKAAAGNSPSNAMPKQPAPTQPAAAPPDIVSQVRSEQNVGGRYGMNGFAGGSSTSNPNEMVRSPLAQSIKDASERGSDKTLDAVIQAGTGAFGTHPVTGDAVLAVDSMAGQQIRKLQGRAQPTTYSMRDPNTNNSKVPSPPNTFGGNGSAFAAELAAKQHGKK